MSSYENFKVKLKQYSIYEDVVAHKLIVKYNLSSEYVKCITNEYDFKLSNNVSYEVKADVMGAKTGNCFIEHQGYGKPSGIATTKANYYVMTFDLTNYYMISVDELKKLIESNSYRIVKTKDGSTFGTVIRTSKIISLSELI